MLQPWIQRLQHLNKHDNTTGWSGVLPLSFTPPAIQKTSLILMLFNPLSDQNGIQTPSWASRLWFLFVMIGTGAYVWLQVSQNLVIWSLCTLIVATFLLNVGWVISVRLSQGKQPSVLFESIDQDESTKK